MLEKTETIQNAPLRASVVINTLNRASLLNKCLQTLRHQTYADFEVIVVNGPSTDNTEQVIDHYASLVKSVPIPDVNLSRSRNAGIIAAAGDVVLFLDDDAYAEPGWIENIMSGYNSPSVGGVGTRVWNHTGFAEQLNPRLVDMYYRPVFGVSPPLWAFEYSASQTIPHILGASSSFRADLLRRIGGFDEEIEYFLDESEVCRRISELGFTIRFLETGPAVHHKYATGVVRDERRFVTRPYPVVKNKYYVTLSDFRRRGGSAGDAMRACDDFAAELVRDANDRYAKGLMSGPELERFIQDVQEGTRDGRERGLTQMRKGRDFTGLAPPALKPFIRQTPKKPAKTFCFITRSLPTVSPGGVAQFICDLAQGFADRGHDVHIITQAEELSYIDFDKGVWTHKISQPSEDLIPSELGFALESPAARRNFTWSKLAHAEILRLRADRPVNLVICPVWDTEGLHCIADPSLKTVLTLQTTFKTFSEIERGLLDYITIKELSMLEKMAVTQARFVHAISDAIRNQVIGYYPAAKRSRWEVARLGTEDFNYAPVVRQTSGRSSLPPKLENRVRLLYVSRLERRKGVDIFMAVSAQLVKVCPDVEIVVIGRDPFQNNKQRSLVETFRREHPAEFNDIFFLGEVDRSTLHEAYASADIFCVPSRFESFGLIYLEAMRASVPVVACRVGGISEIVIDGETGVLVPPDNEGALLSALIRLVQDSRLRRRLGKAGRQRFEAEFTKERMVERVLNLYLDFAKE